MEEENRKGIISKSEFRNSKQFQNANDQILKTTLFLLFGTF